MKDKILSPITQIESRYLFSHKVLGRYDAKYYIDDSIGYIFVHSPYWLDEAYSEAIAVTDTGILLRNARNIKIISDILYRQKNSKELRGIDLAGGYGIFVRGMRDAGFHFFWKDKYADNIFARGFEARNGVYDIAVAFEVLEHLENPLQFLIDAKNDFSFRCCFVSATVFDEKQIPGSDWWYWAFETGQHIGFFSLRCLDWLAKKINMSCYHVCNDIYVFVDDEFKCGLLEAKGSSLFCRLAFYLIKYMGCAQQKKTIAPSLTFSDHKYIRDMLRKSEAIYPSSQKKNK